MLPFVFKVKRMLDKIYTWFENRLNAYPEGEPTPPKKGLFRFIWSSIDGMKGWIFLEIYGVVGRLVRCLYAGNSMAGKRPLADGNGWIVAV